jgi:hypothetical protein
VPSDISESELRNFLQRDQELAPDLSVLLIDTDDSTGMATLVKRLNDFVMPLVGAAASRPTFGTVTAHPGLFYGYRCVYISGSQPSIITQLRRALKHYYANVKDHSFWDGPGINFVTGVANGDD